MVASLSDPNLSLARTEQLVLFAVGETRLALRREAVGELLPLPRLWAPPGLPRLLAGFLNLGGEAVAVLRLSRLLEPEAEIRAEESPAAGIYRHLILLGEGRDRLALLVDRVLDVVRVPRQWLQAVPAEQSLNGCAEAEVALPDGFARLLAPERLLMERERATLAELEAQARRRLEEWAAPS
ncbi:chemotaxis protein CheW [Roseomonas gilardii subsp. gilardii]|uniref:chemotaxis protein CheW n=1 Tax=Roseomonas gilardii TaxID=257708 RepID=UPI001FFBC5B3|nr:chemotaxis protein CheW [Roseomonas gilardii]UPG73415.1 chemotaxis protein CheW [Roseomonas gilardii subsp. gilardii]